MNEAAGSSLSVWSLILDAGVVVQLVLLVLLAVSVFSWAIIWNKWRLFSASSASDKQFSELFWGGTEMQQVIARAKSRKTSPVSHVFQRGFHEYARFRQSENNVEASDGISARGMDSVRHAIDSEWSKQMDAHGSYLSFLATVGSTAPFIGLFGTVWGIIDAFQNIGISQNTSLATVAPGIAEALVATAFGLLAAIPAVVAYNAFSAQMRGLNARLDTFSKEFLNILSRHIGK